MRVGAKPIRNTKMKQPPIELDGSLGEGGGQVLRSALTLSMLTGRGFQIRNIRARRSKPGILRQHLAAVRAASVISQGQCEGAELGSSSLSFQPGTVRGGEYVLEIGSAGSTYLVLQTVLLPLCLASEGSRLVLQGGTHNPWAPTHEFMESTYLPVLRRMGCRVEVLLVRPGFYPAGGGEVRVMVEPSTGLGVLDLQQRGAAQDHRVRVRLQNLPLSIGHREYRAISGRLGWDRDRQLPQVETKGLGPGNAVLFTLRFEQICEVISVIGRHGVKAESVALEGCEQVEHYLSSDAPVGEFLADQLLLPMAVAGGGTFRCTTISEHFRTQVSLIEQFLPVRIATEPDGPQAWRVFIQPSS